jgi:subtilase family serine protease
MTIATVDTAFAVPESFESNNTQILSLTVQQAASDLNIQGVDFSPEPSVVTDAMTATVHVYNQGNTAAGQFRVQWKPSPFGTVQSKQVNGLAANTGTDVVFNYTYALPGTFLTTTTVDVLNSVPETNEFNNLLWQNLVVDPALPDLVVSDTQVTPANPTAGLPAQLQVTVKNVGHRPASDFQVQWKPSPLGLALTQQVNGPLAVGATADVYFDYTYAIGGTFEGTITVDSANRVSEVNESNNQETLPVTVNGSDIDLTITDFSYTPANPVQGENTKFSVTVQNLGNTPATNFELSVNPDAFGISTPGLATQTVQVDSLAGGASQTLTFDFQYPEANNFRAIAEVDAFGEVLESNESNNKALQNLVVSPGSIDLQITDFTLTTDLCNDAVGYANACTLYWKGSTVTAAITVKNNGTYPSDSFVVQWLPDDTSIFGQTATVPGLLPGDTTVVYLKSSYGAAQMYETKATVDLYNQVTEPCSGCETNNTSTKSITTLPRDTSVQVKIEDMYVYESLDADPPGDWWMWFMAYDPNSSCDLADNEVGDDYDIDTGEFVLTGAKCVFWNKGTDDDHSHGMWNGGGPTLNLTLPEFMPLVIAFTGVEDDISCGLFGCDIDLEFPGYAVGAWLPGDYQNAGTVYLDGAGSDDCPGDGRCFTLEVSVTVTQGPPPPASIGSGVASASSVSVAAAESQLHSAVDLITDMANSVTPENAEASQSPTPTATPESNTPNWWWWLLWQW